MARYDDINTPMVAFATVVSCLFLLAIIQATQALTYYWAEHAETKALSAYEYSTSDNLIREQRKTLDGYQWVEKAAVEESAKPEKELHIPIGRAQEVVLEELKSSASGT